MNRIIDKATILLCCFAVLLFIPHDIPIVIALLFALTASSLQESRLLPHEARSACLLLYVALALLLPPAIVFLPLIAYDLVSARQRILRLCWIIPSVAVIWNASGLPIQVVVILGLVSLVSCLLSWKTSSLAALQAARHSQRDELLELSRSLEKRNRHLQEKQDYEVLVATLDERARIAREIHDNVGHLLTRSTLQIKALQVTYSADVKDNPQTISGLTQIEDSITEAFETVRQSVHSLHSDAFDFKIQLQSLADKSHGYKTALQYNIEHIPTNVAYALIAIVREALTNAEKHSDASQVSISAIEYPAFYQLIVQDNGSRNPFASSAPFTSKDGIPRSGTKRHKAKGIHAGNDDVHSGIGSDSSSGIGMHTMAERVHALNGIFKFDYQSGVRIFASIPKCDSHADKENAV
ncbi:MAG: histidine kinase [Coriobacteriia bacterium]|nr:histidine kinase [Coriobacteriia bacterium]